MKNKKGFTLVELLLTLSVLAIISLIVVPNMTSMVKDNKDNEYQRFLSDLFLSTEAYVQRNIDKYPELGSIGGKEYVYVDELLKSRYLKSTLYDTKNNVKITEETDFTIEVEVKEDGTYAYKLYEERYEPLFISKVTQDLLSANEGNTYNYMNGKYLKGVQESNYVWYNGFLWRIMGKNEDGSIRLITEENVAGVPYGASGQGLTYSSNTGYLNDWLNNYFYNNLDKNKTSIIKEADWCINVTTSSTSARTDCTGGTTFNAKVGLITLDEYNLSEASSTNNTYGLVNSQIFWTLTPYSASGAWNVYFNGNANYYDVTNTHGARPVINVDTTATITGGDGTLGDAYILNQTIDFKTGKLNDKASSGEYVSLSGKTYRVVSKDSIGTKLIYDGYYEEVSGTPTMMKYNETSTNVFSTTTGIGQKLNGDVLTLLGNSDKIVPTTWYQTNGFGYGTSYTTILNDTSNPITDTKVGLIRVGEMMSGQSASILTKNYTVRSAYGNAKNYWTMNKYTSVSSAWNVYYFGHASYNDVSNAYGARPVIYVNTDTTITSGNGTLESPYIIE